MTWGRAGCAESRGCTSNLRQKEREMIYCTCILLVIGIMATILGLGGVGAAAVEIAAILFVAEMVYELASQMVSRYTGQA